ncbi:Rho-GTPase-activating protein 8 [Zancudomyces culisetae]|uniref:Rho-GTPase-activating protein 8 n=1 Tax=Zancudomyces culisetae TaxID=1213189 RepID=A0A1R1PGL5_ZANCU|nr:Rho-GTPase-activating protein 8 [Zancudomyces culisetae]|eukprot:OMH80121.1 Rho-GTPase-activating protein 8 [Zancudomyces culisetae]
MPTFKDAFWEDPRVPTGSVYNRGPKQLCEKLEQGRTECDEVLNFLRDRMLIEEQYADALQRLADRPFIDNGFGNDEGGTSMKRAFEGLQTEVRNYGTLHAQFAQELKMDIIRNFSTFVAEHREGIASRSKKIMEHQKSLQLADKKAEKARADYFKKIELVERMERKEGVHRANMVPKIPDRGGASRNKKEIDSIKKRVEDDEVQARKIFVGPLVLTEEEFGGMIKRLMAEIPQREVKYGILGTLRGLVNGEDLAMWFAENNTRRRIRGAKQGGGVEEEMGEEGGDEEMLKTDDEILDVCQGLVADGYLRCMGRGSEFIPKATSYYQWKNKAIVYKMQRETERSNERREIEKREVEKKLPAVGVDGYRADSSQGNRATSWFMGLKMSIQSKDSLEDEIEKAEETYEENVKTFEKLRVEFEDDLMEFYEMMEAWELNRLTNIRISMKQYIKAATQCVLSSVAVCDRMQVYEESIKPEQDLRLTVEQQGVGRDMILYYDQILDPITSTRTNMNFTTNMPYTHISRSSSLQYVDSDSNASNDSQTGKNSGYSKTSAFPPGPASSLSGYTEATNSNPPNTSFSTGSFQISKLGKLFSSAQPIFRQSSKPKTTSPRASFDYLNVLNLKKRLSDVENTTTNSPVQKHLTSDQRQVSNISEFIETELLIPTQQTSHSSLAVSESASAAAATISHDGNPENLLIYEGKSMTPYLQSVDSGLNQSGTKPSPTPTSTPTATPIASLEKLNTAPPPLPQRQKLDKLAALVEDGEKVSQTKDNTSSLQNETCSISSSAIGELEQELDLVAQPDYSTNPDASGSLPAHTTTKGDAGVDTPNTDIDYFLQDDSDEE